MTFDRNKKISPNFYWYELVKGSVVPNKVIQNNLIELAHKLEEVREHLGNRSIIVTSGYRDPEYNRAVGGVRNSQHVYGRAADIVVVGMGARTVQRKVRDWWPGGLGAYSSFTHLDTRGWKARWGR